MDSVPSFIHLDGVRKVYRSRQQDFLANSDFTLDFQVGELVAPVGPTGCGKTTALKTLADLHSPEEGTVCIGNQNKKFNPARDIGLVFQQPLLLKWRRVINDVPLPAEILGMNMAEARHRAGHLLELVGLLGFGQSYPYELSGGMQQRTAIAWALVHGPKLVLKDEPLVAIDALTRDKMNLKLLRIWQEIGKTIINATHGIQKAAFPGSRVVVLTSGLTRMADNFLVDFPYPRTLDLKIQKKIGNYMRRIYKLLGMDWA